MAPSRVVDEQKGSIMMEENNITKKRRRVGGRQKGENRSWENRYSEEQIRELARKSATCSQVEVGRILGIFPDTAGKLARRGELPSFKRGRSRLFNVRQIAALVGVEV